MNRKRTVTDLFGFRTLALFLALAAVLAAAPARAQEADAASAPELASSDTAWMLTCNVSMAGHRLVHSPQSHRSDDWIARQSRGKRTGLDLALHGEEGYSL